MEAIIPHREEKTATLLLQDTRGLRGMFYTHVQVVYQATSPYIVSANAEDSCRPCL